MKTLMIIASLTLIACAGTDNHPGSACAFDPHAQYELMASPDSRTQTGTLNQLLGAAPDAAAECSGENYTVNVDGGEWTYHVVDVDATGAMVVTLSGNGHTSTVSLREQN
jgi:hypothetical protein